MNDEEFEALKAKTDSAWNRFKDSPSARDPALAIQAAMTMASLRTWEVARATPEYKASTVRLAREQAAIDRMMAL